jgi:hypothetical protein
MGEPDLGTRFGPAAEDEALGGVFDTAYRGKIEAVLASQSA